MAHVTTIEQFHSMLTSNGDHPWMVFLRKLTEADPEVIQQATRGWMASGMAYWF